MKNGWTKKLVKKLAEYVQASRYYRVYLGDGVIGEIDFAENPEWKKNATPYDAYCFTSKPGYQDANHDEFFPLEDHKPQDFRVERLKELEWWRDEAKVCCWGE